MQFLMLFFSCSDLLLYLPYIATLHARLCEYHFNHKNKKPWHSQKLQDTSNESGGYYVINKESSTVW